MPHLATLDIPTSGSDRSWDMSLSVESPRQAAVAGDIATQIAQPATQAAPAAAPRSKLDLSAPEMPASVPETEKSKPVLDRVCASPLVAKALDLCVQARAKFQQAHALVECELDPEGTQRAIEEKIRKNHTDIKLIRELQTLHARYTGPAAQAAKDAAAKFITHDIFPFYQEACQTLIDVATTAAEQLLEEAHSEEARFFRAWGLPSEETGVSRRLHRILKDLGEMATGQKPSPYIMPAVPHANSLCHVLQYFGE